MLHRTDDDDDDDEDDFRYHPSPSSFNKPKSTSRCPVEHDENPLNNFQSNSQILNTTNVNHIHVSEREAEQHFQSINNPCSPFDLIPDLKQIYKKDMYLLSKCLGLVSRDFNNLAWIFSDYWSTYSNDKKQNLKTINKMEVFSEGFLVSQALYLDDSCQYFFPKHYRRLTNANFHPNLTSTESVKAVGIGQFGKVYQAVDIQTQQRFAEKIITLEQFSRNELDVLSHITHEHIIKFFGAVRTSAGIHIFMEYADGGSVQQLLENGKGLVCDDSTDEHLFCEQWAITYYKQVLSALVYLHSNHIVHCDVKPSNVVLSINRRKCFLTDFGEVRKIHNNGYVVLDKPIGTQNYCSPEVIEYLRYYYKSDVWSVACFLLHMLTGHIPWTTTYPGADMFLYIIPQKPFKILEEIPIWIHNLTTSILQSSFQIVGKRKSAKELLELSKKDLILLSQPKIKSSQDNEETTGFTEASINEISSDISGSCSYSNSVLSSHKSSHETHEINGINDVTDATIDEETPEYSSSVSPKSISLQDLTERSRFDNHLQITSNGSNQGESAVNGETCVVDDDTLNEFKVLLSKVNVDDSESADDEDVLKQIDLFCKKYGETSCSEHSDSATPGDTSLSVNFVGCNGTSGVCEDSLRQMMASHDSASDDDKPGPDALRPINRDQLP